MLCSPGHARASVNTWQGLFEPSVNTYPEGDVKSIAVRKALPKYRWSSSTLENTVGFPPQATLSLKIKYYLNDMIPGSKGPKSDASLLARGFWTLGPAKNMKK